MNDSPSALHSVTWLLWAIAATAALQLAPNPLYVATVLLVAFLVVETHRSRNAMSQAFGVLLLVATAFSALRVLLIVLTTHTGGAAFLTLPEFTLPRLLGGFTVGGPLEWTVLWTIAAESFVVIGVMAVFGAFNTVASHHELLGAMPRAFHEPGLVVMVALAFVPSTVAAVQSAREADKARTGGRVVRRGRSVRLIIPVLETGLERAVSLAESMDSRGFGRSTPTGTQRLAGWLGLTCLVSLSAAMIALVGSATGWATGLALIGVAALIAAVILAPMGNAATRYRRRRLRAPDFVVLTTSGLALVGIGLSAAFGDDSLRWIVTDEPQFPKFGLVPVLCLLLLAVPAAIPRPVVADTADPVTATMPAALNR